MSSAIRSHWEAAAGELRWGLASPRAFPARIGRADEPRDELPQRLALLLGPGARGLGLERLRGQARRLVREPLAYRARVARRESFGLLLQPILLQVREHFLEHGKHVLFGAGRRVVLESVQRALHDSEALAGCPTRV